MRNSVHQFSGGWVALFFLLAACTSCTPHRSLIDGLPQYQVDDILIFNGKVIFEDEQVIDQEVTIYPEAHIATRGSGKIVFTKRVNIIGESQVFDYQANLDFHAGTLSTLNVGWFGAKGFDGEDDTKAISKVLSLASEFAGSVNIYFPTGRYYINETIEVVPGENGRKTINLIGASMSNNSVEGASISWNGIKSATMFRFSNLNQFRIENLDFTAEPYAYVEHNLEFRPFIHQVVIRNCTFTGVQGKTSANINLNAGNNLQVSEFQFDNCTFNSVWDSIAFTSVSAIKGGLANTKNFYIRNSSFMGYQHAAVDIEVSDVLEVRGCTFAWNQTDISCLVCGTNATSNYSEHSQAFFNANVTSNPAFTTLVNNCFSGNSQDGFVVQGGSGSLILMNNHFGASGYGPDNNKVRWAEGDQNTIYSVGNYYKNASNNEPPFRAFPDRPRVQHVESINDTGGADYTSRIKIILPKN